jgi:hypothetical protein
VAARRGSFAPARFFADAPVTTSSSAGECWEFSRDADACQMM